MALKSWNIEGTSFNYYTYIPMSKEAAELLIDNIHNNLTSEKLWFCPLIMRPCNPNCYCFVPAALRYNPNYPGADGKYSGHAYFTPYSCCAAMLNEKEC